MEGEKVGEEREGGGVGMEVVGRWVRKVGERERKWGSWKGG